MMTMNWIPALALLLPLTHAFADTAEPAPLDADVAPVLACMANNLPSALRVQQIELVATVRDGYRRSMNGRLFVMREDDGSSDTLRAMLRIDAPPAHAGTAYLTRGELTRPPGETYVYLPALRRVRKVTGSFSDGPLLASDFSYREFRMMLGVFDDGEIVHEGTDTIDGRDTTRLRFMPPADLVTPYGSVHVWVDATSCLPLKAEFMQADTVRKRFSVDVNSLARSGDQQYATVSRMDDLAEGSHTVIRVLGVRQNAELPAELFDPESFYRVP
jgi:hypothetical protein